MFVRFVTSREGSLCPSISARRESCRLACGSNVSEVSGARCPVSGFRLPSSSDPAFALTDASEVRFEV
jgi:hypothetical protein